MPLRPLHVIDGLHPRYGGPPRVAVGLACQQAADGMAPEILSLCGRAERAETLAAWPELGRARVPVHLVWRAPPAKIAWSPALRGFCRRRIMDFDVIHFHGIWSAGLASVARAARAAGVPYVVAAHGMLDRWSMKRSRLKKRLAMKVMGVGDMLRRAGGIQFGTVDEAEEARSVGLGAREFVAPNGIDSSLLAPPDDADASVLLRSFPALAGRGPVVLFLGRFHPKKGLHLLLEAFAKASQRYPQAALLILGIAQDEHYEAQIVERARRSDLEGRVFLTSELVGKAALHATQLAQLFVMPSYQEGFSIAVLEALARGLPVLATVPCHLSAVEAAGAGRIVEPTVEALADGLEWFFTREPSDLAEMGARGRSLIDADFTWPVAAAKVEEMYRAVQKRELR